VANAKEWPVAGILTVELLADEVIHFYKHGYPNGYAINLPGLGQKNLQLMLGQFTSVTGIPGSGKSEFVDWMMIQMSRDHGWVWGIVSPENQPSSLHITKLAEKYTGKAFGFRENSAFRISPNELAIALDFIHSHFLFININEVDMSLNGLLDKVEELVVRKGIKGFEFDPWNKVRHDKIDVDYLRSSLNNVSYRCKRSGVHGIIVAHPTKMEREKKGNVEKYKIPTLYSISGGADWYNQTDNGLTVYRDHETGLVTVYRQKIRYNWLGTQGWSSYRYNTLTNNYEYVDSSERKADAGAWVPVPKNYTEPSNAPEENAGDDLPF
jgi:twinkle protein